MEEDDYDEEVSIDYDDELDESVDYKNFDKEVKTKMKTKNLPNPRNSLTHIQKNFPTVPVIKTKTSA